MQPVQNTRPISEFRTHQDEILNQTDESPVVLAQRSRPRVVLVNVDEWNRIAERMNALELATKALHGALKEERKNQKHHSLSDLEAMIAQKKVAA